MSFQRVDMKHASPNALGVLVPPGTKTLVIVRPRALEWDLLPARWDGDHAHAPQFCVFTRDEAAAVARQLIQELEATIHEGVNPLGTFGDTNRACVQIWLRTKDFVWIVCRRQPGQGYQPMIFSSHEEATQVAEMLTAAVWPAVGVTQTYYFNTQSFG